VQLKSQKFSRLVGLETLSLQQARPLVSQVPDEPLQPAKQIPFAQTLLKPLLVPQSLSTVQVVLVQKSIVVLLLNGLVSLVQVSPDWQTPGLPGVEHESPT
jgi:hypothetical protein